MKNNSIINLLKSLSDKKYITEIMINDINKVFVENKGQIIQIKSDLTKDDIDNFVKYVYKLNLKEFDDSPILDGSLDDGSRINIVRQPFVKDSPVITIRKYIRKINKFNTSEKYFGIDENWLKFIRSIVRSRKNIIVAGGTGVGKTTFLNSLLNEIEISERIITIEDTFELDVSLPNIVNLESGKKSLDQQYDISTSDLIKSTLRMRPDRIIVGESRGGELFDLLQAMNTGHTGSMSSIHSNSSRDTLSRMENLFLMSGYPLENKVVRGIIANAINFIIYLNKDEDSNRIVESIIEITGMEGVNILSQQIALFENKELIKTGLVPECINDLVSKGNLNRDFFG